MLLAFFISIIGLLFLLINCILFIRNWKNKDGLYKIVTLYLSVLFVVELLCNIIGFLKPNSNFFLSHYYFNIQFVVLSFFFYKLFKEKLLKLLVVINWIVVILIIGYQYIANPELYWKFNIFEIGITSIILFAYCVIYFFKNLEVNHSYFYFCLGLTFYLSSSAFIFLSGNTELVFFEKPFYFDIWVFNSLFYILYQSLIFKEWKLLNKPN